MKAPARIDAMTWSEVAVRVVVALALGASALVKAIAMAEGRTRVGGLDAVTGLGVLAVAALAELSAAGLLVLHRGLAAGAVALGLALAFSLVVATLLALRLPPDSCGCFGRFSVPAVTHASLIVGLMLCGRFVLLASAERLRI